MTDLVKKYLDKNNYGDQKDNFEDLYNSHPNYPSVYAVTDTLDVLSVENLALKIPKEQFDELPDSFLAHFETEMVLVSKKDKMVEVETQSAKKRITTDAFIQGWSGMILAIEPNAATSESKIQNATWIKYLLPGLALLTLSMVLNKFSIESLVFIVTSLIGAILSVFIVRESFGLKNEAVSKLCNLGTNTSCDSVIKSKKSKINNWLSFSDLPFVFFGVNLLAVILFPEAVTKIIGLMSLISFPILAYSVWIQKFELKKWCLLCLLVAAVVVAQGIGFVVFHAFDLQLTAPALGYYFLPLVLFSSLWFFVRPMLQGKIEAEKMVNELKRFKRNPKLFQTLSKSIPEKEGFQQLEGLRFGTEADMDLTLILSPSCGHCHKAFKDALDLHKQFPERVSFQVLFNMNPENNDNPYKVVVESILTINNYSQERAKDAIIDWHINQLGLEAWKEKWLANSIDMKANHQLYLQYGWCQKNQFNYTPVKIINGNQFPNEYEIAELKYFLNDFSKEQNTPTAEPVAVPL
ncbi:vitamin K epoxide reductase family protein [Flavobacterium pedocola]